MATDNHSLLNHLETFYKKGEIVRKELVGITIHRASHDTIRTDSSRGKQFRGSERVYHQSMLVHKFLKGVERLLDQNDDALARGFLEAFIQYRTLGKDQTEWPENLLERNRAVITGKLQHTLHTTFAESRDISTNPVVEWPIT